MLFLGDSVTYGDGVAYEHVWVSVMQNLVSRSFQLANGSCPGWSTYQQILFFKKYLSNIDWKNIVIAFCLNDLVKFEWVYSSDKTFKMSAEIEL